ncbi:MAG: outer membrane protein assembly factor BamA, partial [Caldimicrobium sp.]
MKRVFLVYFFVFLTVFFFPKLLLADLKILIFQKKSYGDLLKEDLLGRYLEGLKKRLAEDKVFLEIKDLDEKTALQFLKSGEYIGASEVKLTSLKGTLSIDWKIWQIGKKTPFYFYVVGKSEKLEDLIQESLKEFQVFFSEKTLVESLAFEGNRRVGEDVLLPKIRTKAGTFLDYKVLNEDLKNLYKLGYFENIEISLEPGEKGVRVVVKLQERESIKEITFKGLKEGKKEDLAKIIELKPGDIPTPEKVNKALENLKAYYEQLGLHNTEINLKTEKVSPTQVNLVFEIKEGKKKFIKKIEFIGNKAFSEKELKGYLSVSERSIFSPIEKYSRYLTAVLLSEPKAEPGVYNLAFLYRDLGKIESAYKNKGYLEVKIGEPQIVEEPDGVVIKIIIEEGPQYKVAEVYVEQDVFPEASVYKILNTQPGKIFSLEESKNDEVKLVHLFSDYGYAYAKVTTSLDKLPTGNLLKITYKVDKGPVVYINRIEIEGNTKTRDKVIRREIVLAEGWPYSGKRLEKSEERLRRLGYFEDV